MTSVKVIIGSTRPNRFGPKVAKWLMELAKEHPETAFELIDLKEINLPLLDEPQPPSMGNYQNEHTKAWSKIVGAADGFIFITGEYNHGVMPSLKNAIDFVAKEWRYKPVAFVSYGADAGGARAVEHLRGSVSWLGMYDLPDHVLIPNYWAQFDESGAFTATDRQIEDAHRVLKNVGFWANALQKPRKELV